MIVYRKFPGGASISLDTPKECFVDDQFNVGDNKKKCNKNYDKPGTDLKLKCKRKWNFFVIKSKQQTKSMITSA
jgi:hypothetical protein